MSKSEKGGRMAVWKTKRAIGAEKRPNSAWRSQGRLPGGGDSNLHLKG